LFAYEIENYVVRRAASLSADMADGLDFAIDGVKAGITAYEEPPRAGYFHVAASGADASGAEHLCLGD
jgi:hypothetical protein